MKKWLGAYLKNEEQEDLHRFRVQVKKLQAFMIMHDRAGHHRELLRDFRPVKKLFKCAGELRSAYISGQLSQAAQPVGRSVQDFRSLAGKYWKKAKKARRTIRKKIRGIKNKSIESYYRRRLQQTGRVLAAQPSDDQLHDCRKMIKTLLYNEPLVHDLIAVRLNTVYLDQLQEAIGDWHDHLSGQTAGTLKGMVNRNSADFCQHATIR